MDLDSALESHAGWKIKLRAAIDGESTLDAASIGRDDCCALGRWLHGEARRQFPNSPTLADCAARHAAFHCEAGKVATAINARRYDEADAMLGPATPYNAASMAVGASIVRLKRSVAAAA